MVAEAVLSLVCGSGFVVEIAMAFTVAFVGGTPAMPLMVNEAEAPLAKDEIFHTPK